MSITSWWFLLTARRLGVSVALLREMTAAEYRRLHLAWLRAS